MKKLIALLLALVMVLSLMACTAKEEPEKEQEKPADSEQKPAEDKKEETKEEEKEEDPKEEEKEEEPEEVYNPGALPFVPEGEEVTVTLGIRSRAATENYETNEYTLWLEEQTGVNLEFVYFSDDQTECTQQFNMMIAGGQKLPDIMFRLRLDTNLINEVGADGYLADLKPLIEEHGYWLPWLMECIEVEGDDALLWALGTDPASGGFYGFPLYGAKDTSIDGCQTVSLINKNWLEAVGKEIPTNVDELYEVLKLFATEDPNGNGAADEIAMMGAPSGWTDIVQFVINAYVYCSDTYMFNVDNGELWIPYNTDEYREALVYLNKLYSEGLLSPIFYSGESNLTSLMSPADGVALLGVAGAHPTLHCEQDNEVMYEYVALPPLADETGKGGYGVQMASSFTYGSYISAEAEDPALCYKILDFMLCPESQERMRRGTPGVHFEYCTGDELNNRDLPAFRTVIDASVYTAQNNNNWHIDNSFTTYKSLEYGVKDERSGNSYVADGSWKSMQTALNYGKEYGVRTAYDNAPRKAEVVYNLIYNETENELVSEIQTPLMDYIKEQRALFISGVLDPSSDADWETYLADLEAQGVNDWIAAAQAAYDRMYK